MTYTVYADVLFLLNFFIDYICLYAAIFICRLRRRQSRIIGAAFIGGVYSIAALIIEAYPFPFQVVIHLLAAALICFTAFPADSIRRFFKGTLTFICVCAVSGGAVTSVFSLAGKYVFYNGSIYVDVSAPVLAAMTALFCVLVLPFFITVKRRISVKTARIKITREGKQETFDVLIDSGNLLHDPVSADGIILLKASALSNFFGEGKIKAMRELDVMSADFPSGIRLVPSEKGVIPIFKPQETEIKIFGEKKWKKVYATIGIDFSSGSFAGSEGLLPLSYIE